GDRILHINSHGKKLKVEEHRRNVKLPKNKTSVTACNDSFNAKTLNVKSVSAMCDKRVMIDKHDLCVLKSVAKPIKKTVASESNKKPRNNVRKLHERFGKTYKWTYISMPLGNAVGNKMHKAFPLPGESSYWKYKFPLPVEGVPTARRMEIPLPGVCTAMMKKLPVKEN
nr:hypothetical protein [Tanacetum cinerariifolium]